MEIIRHAIAGTMESSDIYLEVFPTETETEIELTSTVMQQFGEDILATMRELLAQMQVKRVRIRADDRGALDCVVRARLETALIRSTKEVLQ